MSHNIFWNGVFDKNINYDTINAGAQQKPVLPNGGSMIILYVLLGVLAYILMGGVYVWCLRRFFVRNPHLKPHPLDAGWFGMVFFTPSVRAGFCWPIPVVYTAVMAVVVSVVALVLWILNGFEPTDWHRD